MNQDTEKNINEAIDWLQQVGGSVQDFAVEQAPLYCREVVAWKLWEGVAMCTLSAAFVVVSAVCWKIALRWRKEEATKKEEADKKGYYYSTSDGFVGPMIGGIAAIIAAIVLLGNGAPQAIKAAVAPRLVIVEHLRGLTK